MNFCENNGSRFWELCYTSSSLEDCGVTKELYMWYLLIMVVCFFPRLCLDWPQFVLAKNLPNGEIVGYLYVDCSFAKKNIQV